MANKFTIVRSFASGNGGHTYASTTTANNPTKAAMSALYSRVAGTNHPKNAMPRNVVLMAEALDPTLKLQPNFETQALQRLYPQLNYPPSMRAWTPQSGF